MGVIVRNDLRAYADAQAMRKEVGTEPGAMVWRIGNAVAVLR